MPISFNKMWCSVCGKWTNHRSEKHFQSHEKTEFTRLASKAAGNLTGDCPLLEDEAIVWAWNKIQRLTSAIEKTLKSDDGASDLVELMEAINMPIPSTTHIGIVHGEEVKYCSASGKMWKRKHGHWVLSKARDSYGYRRISLGGASRYVHRVAFSLMGYEIADGMQIDHINGVKHDCRAINMRICTASENALGYRDSYRDTLPRNITKVGVLFRVEIKINGIRHRPYFSTLAGAEKYLAKLLNSEKT